jgi:hypothetical protein
MTAIPTCNLTLCALPIAGAPAIIWVSPGPLYLAADLAGVGSSRAGEARASDEASRSARPVSALTSRNT